MNPDRIRALVLQNAETSRLLGVDYVPMYRTGALAEPAPETPIVVEPTPQPHAPSAPAPPRSIPQPPPPAAPLLNLPATNWLPTCSAELAAARSPTDRAAAMEALRARYESDAPHKRFKTDHHNIVWGEGDIRARLMFVGEAPGEEEDKTGRPFVGRAGQLLDKMIGAMGLSRADVYIANVLKTRPPGNATPTLQEAEICAPYLFEQIAIISPEVIVTLGLPSTRLLLRTEATMSSLRGRWSSFKLPDGRLVPVMPTYHPAYVLRSYTADVRGKVWSDLQLAMKRLGIDTKGKAAPGE